MIVQILVFLLSFLFLYSVLLVSLVYLHNERKERTKKKRTHITSEKQKILYEIQGSVYFKRQLVTCIFLALSSVLMRQDIEMHKTKKLSLNEKKKERKNNSTTKLLQKKKRRKANRQAYIYICTVVRNQTPSCCQNNRKRCRSSEKNLIKIGMKMFFVLILSSLLIFFI